MLDLDPTRPAAPIRDAATLVILRDAPEGLEVFAVERNKRSRFLGGALVFPGGKVDLADRDPAWAELTTPHAGIRGGASEPAFAIAGCREALEEAAILPVASVTAGGIVGHEDLLALRQRLATDPGALRAFLTERGLRLDLGSLVPFARWVTPAAEHRRFDALFFVVRLPEGQVGAHDDEETKASFWARPADLLARFDRGEVALFPPTHRTLEQLTAFATAADAIRWAAEEACLDPVCPELVRHADAGGETLALTLPGDPEHSVREARLPGRSRFVLRGEQWRPEAAPARQ